MENSSWERLIDNLIKESVLHSPRVIKAMRSVPRESFLPADVKSYSSVDSPLPIGFGQTASAPHSASFVAALGETWSQ